MTICYERTRALRWAYEFLCEVRASDEVPESFSRQASQILRHYPNPVDIEWQAKSGVTHRDWLCAEPDRDQPEQVVSKRTTKGTKPE